MIIANSLAPFNSEIANLVYWIALLSVAGIIGNIVGYWFGKKSGPLLFEQRETWLFKRKHLLQAKDFYDKKGGSAIVLARFLPIVERLRQLLLVWLKWMFKNFYFLI